MELIYCERCGGPAKRVHDVLGAESVECDAMYPCQPETPLERLLNRAEAESERFWDDLTEAA